MTLKEGTRSSAGRKARTVATSSWARCCVASWPRCGRRGVVRSVDPVKRLIEFAAWFEQNFTRIVSYFKNVLFFKKMPFETNVRRYTAGGARRYLLAVHGLCVDGENYYLGKGVGFFSVGSPTHHRLFLPRCTRSSIHVDTFFYCPSFLISVCLGMSCAYRMTLR